MERHGQAMLLALGLLTRLPVHYWLSNKSQAAVPGLAVAYYPLVGALLGLLLWLTQNLLGNAAPMLSAFVLLALWVALTGALHLDGLADCVDGYFAGHKLESPEQRRDKALAVMREPACGALAVVALILVLLGKWAALSQLLQNASLSGVAWLLLLALPRAMLLPYVLTTDYARPQGMASALKAQVSGPAVLGASAATAGLAVVLWPLSLALPALAVLGLLTWTWRALWQRTIGGFTGDCLGALVELAELSLLLVLAFALA